MSTVHANVVRPRAAAPDPHASLKLWLRLLTCSSLIERHVRGRLREEFGITLPRFDVLAQLEAAAQDDVGGLTMSELSRRLMVTNGNLTGLVERLVREGLVRRAALATDRRAQLVRLTPAGRRALHAMTPRHEQWIEDMLSALPPEDRAQLHVLLGRLRASIQHTPSEEHPS